jgi:very-short-patch-repair endonuclease
MLPTGGAPLWACFRQHRFSMSAELVSTGGWCELCTESLGERAVRAHLERRGLDYRCEMSFPSLVAKEQLRFDFYVPALALLIEVDGEQHFGSVSAFKGSLLERLEHDEIKDSWARRERFSLLRLPYWELDVAERVIDSALNRLHAGEGPLYECVYAEWRDRALHALRQKKRAPAPPVPANARERTLEARRARRDEASTELAVAAARSSAPDALDVS